MNICNVNTNTFSEYCALFYEKSLLNGNGMILVFAFSKFDAEIYDTKDLLMARI